MKSVIFVQKSDVQVFYPAHSLSFLTRGDPSPADRYLTLFISHPRDPLVGAVNLCCAGSFTENPFPGNGIQEPGRIIRRI